MKQHHIPVLKKNNSERGNISIVLGLSLTTLLAVMAFTLNTGYLFSEKNRYQNAVDAAALAGAIRLCTADPGKSARQVFLDNLLPNDPLLDNFEDDDLEVQVGFYDVFDEYASFSEYKDFIEEDQMPTDQWENAVMVRLLTRTTPPVSGMLGTGAEDGNGKISVEATAVAYLKRYDMMALKEEEENGDKSNESKLWTAGFKNGDVRSNGNIIYPKKWTPALSNASISAHGQVYSCTMSSSIKPNWENQQAVVMEETTNTNLITDITPCDDGYVNSLKATADVVYEPGEEGDDEIFFGYGGTYMSGGIRDIAFTNCYMFDLAETPDARITYFFDASSLPEATALVTTAAASACVVGEGHIPRGDRIANVTFIANCPIVIYSPANVGISLRVGDKGDRQAVFISSDDIVLHNSSSSLALPKGVSFRCGGNFYLRGYFYGSGFYDFIPGYDMKIRIIADGFIDYESSSGIHDFSFGPPCPPTVPRLGRLEAISFGE